MVFVRVLWDGKVFHPHSKSLEQCKKLEHTWHTMSTEGERSTESHNHYFAKLEELFSTLPEETAARFRNIDHFRSWCLIHEGFANEQCLFESSPSEAQVAARTLRKREPFSMVDVSGTVVRIWSAESQARNVMSRKRFEESKQKVLELAEHLVNGGELAA